LEYLVKARAVKVGDSNLMEQTGTFLGALTASVSACPGGVLVAALPASSLEVSAEDRESAERLFQHARKVLGRMELVETPVTQDEVFGVLRRRLFRSLGNEREHKKAVEALQDYYGEYARFFPEQLRSPDYKQRMLAAYPFHPALIDLLYERWGPHPQFQRTRGALRLLALVLRRLWQQRSGSAFLIQPHHLELSDRHVRGEIVRLLDGGFDTIITGDVLQKANEIERELSGDYAREQLGKGAATCALLYSVSAGARDIGATEEEIRTALLRPDINPAMVSEVLGRLRDGLWYLRYRDRRYYFSARPNLNKVILDYEEEIARDEGRLAEEFNRWLQKVVGKGEGAFQAVVAPVEPSAVPDHPRPTLVVLSPEVTDERAWMNQAAQYAGGSIRRHKNMLVFLAARQDSVGAIQSALKRWLALQSVSHSASFRELDSEDKEQVKGQLKDKETELEALLLRSYARLYRPSHDGIEEVPLRQSPESFKARTLTQFVEAVLKQEGVVLESIAPEFLMETLHGDLEQRGELPVQQVETLLTGVPGQPMVRDPQETLTRTIREGAQKGV
ncbi:MAG: ATP-binding protein, partial [Abditibacteriales bacterium]|nr:ATP-binding protein [Abditibacteriales bacterium]